MKMKTTIKTLAIVVATSLTLMGGCLDDLININIDYTAESEVQTTAVVTTGTNTLGNTVVTSELESKLKEKDGSLADIDEIKAKSVSVRFKAPGKTDNFNSIESFEVWLFADGLQPVKIASKDAIPDGLTSVDVDVNSDVNLADYLKKPTFTYELKGTNSAPIQPMSLIVKGTFNVKASVN